MSIYYKIIIDKITDSFVGLVVKQFETNVKTNEEKQVGLNSRRAFANSETDRVACQNYIKGIDENSTIFEDIILPIWADKLFA